MRQVSFYLLVIIAMFSVNSLTAQEESEPYEGVSLWEETKDERMAWFREARFGMFVHWGLYSAAGGSWDGKVYPQDYAEWIQTWAKIPSKEYAEVLKPQFTAAKFDAKEWAALAKEAGMRYLIVTSRHHDGFSIFNSKQSYSLDNPITGGTNISPEGRDLYGELIDAFQEEGLKTGAYYSLLDWQHPDSYEGFQLNENTEDYQPDHDVYREYIYQQIKELATNYAAFDVLWVDFSSKEKQGETWGTKRILEDLIQWRPEIIVNNRFWDNLENKNGDIGTPEKYIPPTGLPDMDWEVSHTMNESYGYSEHDDNWKSFDQIMHLFVETVSKGGNFLLNVGPDGEGAIPDEAADILQKIGNWMKINQLSIYGTTASPFSNLDWGYSTQKEGKIFLHIFDRPSSGLISLPLENTIKNAAPLYDPNQELEVTTAGEYQRIKLPENRPPVEGPEVVVIEIDGKPEVLKSQIEVKNDGSIALTADNAEFSEESRLKLIGASHNNPNRPNAIGGWSDPDERVYWEVKFPKPGTYKVNISYLPHSKKSGEVALSIGDHQVTAQLKKSASDRKDFKEVSVGEIEITQQDLGDSEFQIILKALNIENPELPEISSVRLIPE